MKVMNSVNCVNCQAQRTENRHKGVRRFANNAVTLAGVGATGLLFRKGVNLAVHEADKMLLSGDLNYKSNLIGTKTGNVLEFFEKMGIKIFKKGTKLGNAAKHYIIGQYPKGDVLSEMGTRTKLFKVRTVGAMALTAGVAALGILARGIYKAGKINGEQ